MCHLTILTCIEFGIITSESEAIVQCQDFSINNDIFNYISELTFHVYMSINDGW